MSDAYRDDLAAARQRVADLEREHAELAARNRELQALVPAAPAPVQKRDWELDDFDRGLIKGALFMVWAVIGLVCLFVGIHSWMKPVFYAATFLYGLGLDRVDKSARRRKELGDGRSR